MYTVHHEATMIPIDLTTTDYVLGTDKLPAISASASRDAQGVVHISLVNIDSSKPQEVTIDVRGSKLTSVSGRVLTSEKIQDFNSFDQPSRIKPVAFKDAAISGTTLKVKLPPHSVVVLEAK
jgi:alpha-L-arabinofuranosidase